MKKAIFILAIFAVLLLAPAISVHADTPISFVSSYCSYTGRYAPANGQIIMIEGRGPTGAIDACNQANVGTPGHNTITVTAGNLLVFMGVNFCFLSAGSQLCTRADITGLTDALGNSFTVASSASTNQFVGSNPLVGVSILTGIATHSGTEPEPGAFTLTMSCGACNTDDLGDTEFWVYQYANAQSSSTNSYADCKLSACTSLNVPITTTSAGAWIDGFAWDNGAGRPLTYTSSQTHTLMWAGSSGYLAADFGPIATAGTNQAFSFGLAGPNTDTIAASLQITTIPPPATSGLSSSPAWTAEGNNQNLTIFGQSVSTAGDVNGDGYSDVIVGQPDYNSSTGQYHVGRVLVYYGSARGLSTVANWTAQGSQAGANFGYSVGTAGDVNKEGFSDIIIGAPDVDNSSNVHYGHAYIYLGSASGLRSTPSWTVTGGTVLSYLGWSVGTAGDVNKDGYSDVIVGAPYDRNPTTIQYTGMAYVFYGSATGPSTTANWSAGVTDTRQIAGTGFGFSVGTAGDVNGDGYSDVVIGSPDYDVTSVPLNSNEGKVFAYYGSASGLSTIPNWTFSGNATEEQLGYSVGTAGDVNKDGRSDVIIGAPCAATMCTVSPMTQGLAFVFLGSATGLSTGPSWSARGGQSFSFFGYSVGTAGDVNGDGYSDIIVGAPSYDTSLVDEGRVLVYYGSPTGPSTTPSWSADSNQAEADFGLSVGTAGDVNRDGGSDIIIGSPRHRSYEHVCY